MSTIKLENLLGAKTGESGLRSWPRERTNFYLAAWKQLESIGANDLLSWQILYELDDGQWKALQSWD